MKLRFTLFKEIGIVLFLIFAVNLFAGQSREIPLTHWLQLGPIPVYPAAFSNPQNTGEIVKELINFRYANVKNWWVAEKDVVQWDADTRLTWQRMETDTSGLKFILPTEQAPDYALNYLATYLDAHRWTEATLKISSNLPFQLFLDGGLLDTGAKVSANTNSDKNKRINNSSKKIQLETGKHILVIKTLFVSAVKQPWVLKVKLTVPEKYGKEAVSNTIDPSQRMTIHLLLDTPRITGVGISPDGQLATVNIRKAIPPTNKSESWIELREVKTGKLLQTFRGGMKLSALKWAPVGRKFAYTSKEKDETTLWIVDLQQGTTTPLLEKVKNFKSYNWGPDGNFIIYSVTRKAPKNKTGVKKLQALRDRWPHWRDRDFLYRVNVASGSRERLTAGKLTTDFEGISPDGSRLLFTREIEDLSERPYGKTQLFVMNLNTLKIDTLWVGAWFNSAKWGADVKTLLLTGGPSMFGDLGRNLPEGMIPNEYDTQAYLFDLATKTATPISRDFDPDIISGYWMKNNRSIYFTATAGEYRKLFRYNLRNKTYREIDTGVDVINAISFAKNAPVAVYYGSSATVPAKAYVLDLKKHSIRLLSDPAAKDYQYVKFGKVEEFDFVNERGDNIDGRVYYPPDYDPAKKYPVIVYYYGGVNTTVRSFGGRYPKNLFAAQGYLVYVLQPSGATGYGQRFSAYHVNDWGKIVSDEIIMGVSKFLQAHPNAIPERIAGIGASYGGFMTMLLVTKTNMFRAAVAHAGISSISSYWGQGYWGFLYSAVATANSFPWNRKDIYVGQSPLFRADRVDTPILLLHGTADTNVPTGESIQFYTALKLLGKPVEFVEIFGQNHWILEYGKRKMWQKSILAWFDKWLKDQPEWWENLYPEK